MSKPTSDQLAEHVPPLVRDYIDARISEQAAILRKALSLAATDARQTLDVTTQRLAEIDTFEKTVRGHLGL